MNYYEFNLYFYCYKILFYFKNILFLHLVVHDDDQVISLRQNKIQHRSFELSSLVALPRLLFVSLSLFSGHFIRNQTGLILKSLKIVFLSENGLCWGYFKMIFCLFVDCNVKFNTFSWRCYCHILRCDMWCFYCECIKTCIALSLVTEGQFG